MFEFTINGATYYAEDGMTWNEWVNSEYNTFGNDLDKDRFIVEGIGYITDYDNEHINSSSKIIADYNYYLSWAGPIG